MKLINNVTIGADIELFLRDKTTNDIISAEGFIQGTKDKPFVYDETNRYFAVSLDNVLAEFCIPPANNPLDFYKYIKKSVEYIQSVIPKEFICEALPSAILKDKYLQTEHSQRFGCEPDYNAWLRECNPIPEATNKNLRSAGGHIHVGYDEPNMEINERIIKAMDLFIGVPSVIQEPDNERKILYGKAGAFRFKDYGVEYRTVSNYYLNSEELIKWVFDRTMDAIDFVNKEGVIEHCAEDIQNAINNNNKELAKGLINYFKIKLAA